MKTSVVNATTIYNVPLSEYPLVLDCRSREKYKNVHVKISWNVVPEEGVDRVISEAFDEDPPEMNHKVILIRDEESNLWSRKVVKWFESRNKNEMVERWRCRVKEILILENIREFEEEYGFLVVRNTPSRGDTNIMPYPNRVLPELYIGSISHASEKSVLKHCGITHILNCTKKIKNYFEDDFQYLKLNIVDDEETSLQDSMFRSYKFIDSALKSSNSARVLVHCHQGKSRSASMVLFWLMQKSNSISPTRSMDCLAYLKNVRSIVMPNPCFMRQLAVFDILGRENFFKFKTKIVNETRRAEIKMESSWGSLLQKRSESCSRSPISDDRKVQALFPEAFLISNVFSRDECKSLLSAAESAGYGRTQYPHDYRGNLRLLTVDKSLSNVLWTRIRPLCPAYVRHRDSWWIASGLNDHWRLSKYLPGDQFQVHCDASVNIHQNLRSMFTVNIYMNDEFLDGNTRFFQCRDGEIISSINPRYGLALIFRQPPDAAYLHDGERVRSGLKYLFRTDIFYTRLSPSEFSTEESVLSYLKKMQSSD